MFYFHPIRSKEPPIFNFPTLDSGHMFKNIQKQLNLIFLIYVNDMPNPGHHQTDKPQFADDAGQWAVSKNIDLAVEYLQRDLDKLARWCAKWRIKLNPEKTKVIIFSKSRFAIRAEPALSLYGDLLSYHPQIKFLGYHI